MKAGKSDQSVNSRFPILIRGDRHECKRGPSDENWESRINELVRFFCPSNQRFLLAAAMNGAETMDHRSGVDSHGTPRRKAGLHNFKCPLIVGVPEYRDH